MCFLRLEIAVFVYTISQGFWNFEHMKFWERQISKNVQIIVYQERAND